jgi:hypothetical protein
VENVMMSVMLVKKIKNTIVEPSLFLNLKRQYIYLLIEDSKVELVFELNNAGLNKVSNFV